MQRVYATEQQVSTLSAYGVLSSQSSILTTEEADVMIEQYRSKMLQLRSKPRKKLPSNTFRRTQANDYPGQRNDPKVVKAYREMRYEDYLRTPWWNKVRRAAILRAKGRCQRCNIDKIPLDVHHKTYARLGAELDTDVIAVCRKCHNQLHRLD